MAVGHPLPEEFRRDMQSLEAAYLSFEDPVRRSGFGGGDRRWRAERGMILAAVEEDGTLLDVGCANGYLLACLVEWARPKRLLPFGVDLGERLVDLARARLRPLGGEAWQADAWVWSPPMAFDYVYTLVHLAPAGREPELVRRVARFAAPGGRVILGDYGSRSRGIAPRDVAAMVRAAGYEPQGTAFGGDPALTMIAWFDPDGVSP